MWPLLLAALLLLPGLASLATASRQGAPLLTLSGQTPAQAFDCQWRNFTQTLDHFNASDSRTFQQQMVVCPGAWPAAAAAQAATGSLIFFLGNEAPLPNPPSQPIIFENAARMGALIVQLEHRYYGQSRPFPAPPDAPSGLLPTPQYAWLTIEQVMEDSKAAVEAVRRELGVPAAVPTLVIGGSYGGNLAAWHRVTHPDTFHAAIASSGPVKYTIGTPALGAAAQNFHDIIGAAVTAITGNASCADAVRAGGDEIMAARTPAELRALGERMQLCNASALAASAPAAPLSLLQAVYYAWAGNAVQVNGQGGALQNFTADACSVLQSALRNSSGDAPAALSVSARFINGGAAAQAQCWDVDVKYKAITDPAVDMPAYMYQLCSQGSPDQTALPSSGAARTLIPAYPLTEAQVVADCREAFGPALPPLTPPPVAADFEALLAAVGRVVFTNGERDGWGGGSIKAAIPGVVMGTVVYPGASHCTDVHAFNWNNTAEPRGWKPLRAKAMDMAIVWLEEARAAAGNGSQPASGGPHPRLRAGLAAAAAFASLY